MEINRIVYLRKLKGYQMGVGEFCPSSIYGELNVFKLLFTYAVRPWFGVSRWNGFTITEKSRLGDLSYRYVKRFLFC